MFENIDVFAVRVTLHTGMARVVKFYLIMEKDITESIIANLVSQR